MGNSCPNPFHFQVGWLVVRCINFPVTLTCLLVRWFVWLHRMSWFISKTTTKFLHQELYFSKLDTSVFTIVLRKVISRMIAIVLTLLWDYLSWLMLLLMWSLNQSHYSLCSMISVEWDNHFFLWIESFIKEASGCIIFGGKFNMLSVCPGTVVKWSL